MSQRHVDSTPVTVYQSQGLSTTFRTKRPKDTRTKVHWSQGQERAPRALTTALASLCNMFKYFRLLCKNWLTRHTTHSVLQGATRRLLSRPTEKDFKVLVSESKGWATKPWWRSLEEPLLPPTPPWCEQSGGRLACNSSSCRIFGLHILPFLVTVRLNSQFSPVHGVMFLVGLVHAVPCLVVVKMVEIDASLGWGISVSWVRRSLSIEFSDWNLTTEKIPRAVARATSLH